MDNKRKKIKRIIKKKKDIYMDYAASVLPNPSSIHKEGINAKIKLQTARAKIADILNAQASEIIFTSGATESNNLAIQGVIFSYLFGRRTPEFRVSDVRTRQNSKKKQFLPHIITTNIEHPSVLETCKSLEKRGFAEVSIVGVEANGIVDSKKIKKAIKKNTVLVSVMYANNEIGTIQPIYQIAKMIRHFRKMTSFPDDSGSVIYPLFHTDAVQGANYLDIDVKKLGVDMLSLSGFKIKNGSKVGLLYKKRTVELQAIMFGGDQEWGFSPGTENLSTILAFTKAFELTRVIKEKEYKRLLVLRDYFLSKLYDLNTLVKAGMIINGDLENRLPNNINITIPKIPSDLLVIELSAKGIMTSAKSACKSSQKEGSYVIQALGKGRNPLIGGLRFSLGEATTKAHIDYTVLSLSLILNKLKKWYIFE